MSQQPPSGRTLWLPSASRMADWFGMDEHFWVMAITTLTKYAKQRGATVTHEYQPESKSRRRIPARRHDPKKGDKNE